MSSVHDAPLASRTFLRWQTSNDARLEVVMAEMGEQGLPPHFHDMWSVGVVVHGDCRFHTLPHGKEVWHLAPAGSVFVLRPYETHACGAGIGGHSVRYALVYVDATEMCHLAPGLAALHSTDSRRVWPKQTMACRWQSWPPCWGLPIRPISPAPSSRCLVSRRGNGAPWHRPCLHSDRLRGHLTPRV